MNAYWTWVRIPPPPPYGGLAQLARAPALHAGGHRFDSDILHKKINIMKKDYEFVIKVIRNKENRLIHYPAIKNLVDIWKNKWIGSKEYNKSIYDVYLHSLKLNLKRSFK